MILRYDIQPFLDGKTIVTRGYRCEHAAELRPVLTCTATLSASSTTVGLSPAMSDLLLYYKQQRLKDNR